MSHIYRSRIRIGCVLMTSAVVAGVTACGGSASDPLAGKPYDAADQIRFTGISKDDRRVDPDKPLEVTSNGGGRITDVTATDAAGRYVRGELSEDGKRWRSTTPLAAGAHYTVRVSTENGHDAPGRRTIGFDTAPADKRLRVRFGPDSGTYGVGQPVTAELSEPVKKAKDRAIVERALKVRSRPAVRGAWHWVDDRTLHYRPPDYWPAHGEIEVHSDLEGIRVGKVHGAPAKPIRLRTGAKVVAVTDAETHKLTVERDGKAVRTVPVTTGKAGFETRNGKKVVLAKEPFVRMRSGSVGIAEGSSESYDLPVHWATRVTWSGEYLHAAPWSVGSQGAANTSHGCTGMSTDDAHWLFDALHVGDIVSVVNSGGDDMTPFDNGFGDWNMSWRKWRQGSATQGGGGGGGAPADTSRLRPGI